MTGGSLLILVVMLATLSQWLQERFFSPMNGLRGYPMVLLSAAIGVGLCFGFGVDILSLIGLEGSYVPWLGKVVSGLIIGSGSNILHHFIKHVVKVH